MAPFPDATPDQQVRCYADLANQPPRTNWFGRLRRVHAPSAYVGYRTTFQLTTLSFSGSPIKMYSFTKDVPRTGQHKSRQTTLVGSRRAKGIADMFVPSQYREPDNSWISSLILQNPLALLVTNGSVEAGPHATHLPVIPDPAAPGDWTENLDGATLLGHLNRANPHWRSLQTGTKALLTFTGPHAYVSPTIYQVTPAAPTWNFTAVHIRGTIELIDQDEETLYVVQSTVQAFEAAFGADWDASGSVGYFRKILPGVGAFRFKISSAEGMFKLSQEQSPEIRERVQRSFSERDCTRHRATAALMSRLP
jgi:transcriptional regulator